MGTSLEGFIALALVHSKSISCVEGNRLLCPIEASFKRTRPVQVAMSLSMYPASSVAISGFVIVCMFFMLWRFGDSSAALKPMWLTHKCACNPHRVQGRGGPADMPRYEARAGDDRPGNG